MLNPSALIRYKRLERNWSQEGLCEGICAVSYLSKIEQGKADPNPEMLRALMDRLEIVWYEQYAKEAHELIETIWESIISNIPCTELMEKLEANWEHYFNGPEMLNCLLMKRMCQSEEVEPDELLSAFEDQMDVRQRTWHLLSQRREEEALRLMPIAFLYLTSGEAAYAAGNFTQAAERLLHCCALAAEEGRARVLMTARAMLGGCYSTLRDYEAMNRHYAVAMRLARDLNDHAMQETLEYNIAATDLSLGKYEKAYAYFASIQEPYALALHKTAICLEKMGRREDALQMLDRVKDVPVDRDSTVVSPNPKWMDRMCALVRYRLTHPNYLRDEYYGRMLLNTYHDIQREMPSGFVLFHRPWVEEWYVANRQYKQAYELWKNVFS